ncbi:rRNA-processing protein and EBNA1-binding protein ebp2 [Actinomortierella ambigua]|nr:rRNA-processing protein and EBNA1-binding protein ebp2 [Actinomortierella ambigua]
MSSDSEHSEQEFTLEDLEGSDIEMISEDEENPIDIVPQQRVTVNNEQALRRLREQIELPKDLPFSETQSVMSSKAIEVVDPDDDLKREVAFYEQALEAAVKGRELLKKEGIPFERPDDYFAEMVKSDEHMAKIRQRLLDENASIQASERAKAQRELKKFGKKVQIEKRLEREKAKADALDKIETLKKKRQQNAASLDDGDSQFDIALASDEETPAKSGGGKGNNSKKRGAPSTQESRNKRLKKNQKFGFGGKKRNAKSNTADSSADMSGFSVKRNKSGSFKAGAHKAAAKKAKASAKRPGKSRRMNSRK